MTAAEQRSIRGETAFVAAAALAAVALRGAAASYRGGYLGWDETMYLVMGRNLLTGHGYQMYGPPSVTYPPLPGIVAAAVWMLTGSTRWAMSAPSAILGGLAVVPVYLVARRMFSRNAAIAAAAIFVLMRPLLMWTPFTTYKLRFYSGSEQMHVFFVAWGVYFLERARSERRVRPAALAGLALGIGFYARHEALVICGALAAWLAAASVITEKRVSRSLLLRVVAALGVFAGLAAPWFVYTSSVTGSVGFGPHLQDNMALREAFRSVYSGNDWRPYFRVHHDLNADGAEYASPYYGVTAWHREHYYGSGGGSPIVRAAASADFGQMRLWLSDIVTLLSAPLAVLALLGLAGRPSREHLARLLLLPAALAPAALIAATLLVLPRYNVYALPVFAVFAGAGTAGAVEFAGRLARARTAAVTAAVLAMASGIAGIGAWRAFELNARSRADMSGYDRRMEETAPRIGAELARLAPGATLVLAHDPQPVFAAGDVWLPLPSTSFEEIVRFARAKGARLIVLKRSDEGMRRFRYADAVERTDLVRAALRHKYFGEEVAILEVVEARD